MRDLVIDYGIPVASGMINAEGSWRLTVWLFDHDPPPFFPTFGMMGLGIIVFSILYVPLASFLKGK